MADFGERDDQTEYEQHYDEGKQNHQAWHRQAGSPLRQGIGQPEQREIGKGACLRNPPK